jgi:hypothetical protein
MLVVHALGLLLINALGCYIYIQIGCKPTYAIMLSVILFLVGLLWFKIIETKN